MKTYLIFNFVTHEITGEINCTKWNAPRNSVQVEALPFKEGFAVVLNKELTATEYILDLRGKTIYSTTNVNESEVVSKLGEIKAGWTLNKPTAEFDTWKDDAWVTDTQAEFESNMLAVDNKRRSLYFFMNDPLIFEANIERLQGNEDAAVKLEKQAIAAREKIRIENPWPIAPSV